VTLSFDVPDDLNADVHNVDFHAVYGPGGGAIDTTIGPGEGPVEIEFRLEYPGAHIYRRSRPSASGLDPEGEGRKPR